MLAKLLRRMLLSQALIGAAIGYWVSRHGESIPWAMVLGALCAPVLTMVLVDIVSAVLSRGREPMGMWWRALFGEFHAGVVVFLLRQPWTYATPAVRPATNGTHGLPVLLIHGYMCNHRIWDDVSDALRSQGHTVLAINLEPLFKSIDKYTPVIENAVQQLRAATGQDKVVLVGHSMGGLAARAWMRVHGIDHAAGAITLGTPHVGTKIAKGQHSHNGKQMEWHSPWLTELAASETAATRALFQIAITPQDNIVFPQRQQVLAGITPTVFEGLGHLQLCLDRTVIAWLLTRIAALQPR